MATDTDDQGFDEALKNFQLLTGLSPAPAVIIPAGNPFQIGPSAPNAFRDNDAVVKQIFGTHCECGAERILPSTFTCSSSASAGKHNQPVGKHSTSLEHGIINATPFKHKVKGEKRAIVRESMLKNIGKCVHQNMVKQSSIAKEAAKQQNSPNTFLPAVAPASQLKPSLSETNLTKCFNNDESGDILDFRILVAQCSELTLSSSASTSKSSSGGPNYSQSSFKSLRQPDFASFQLNRSTGSSSSANLRRNRRTRQLKRYNSTSSLESDSSSSNGSGVPFGVGPLGAAGGTCTTGPSTSSQNPQQQQSPSASSPSSSASASCSTQARLNNVMPCDITIDEMASYFETLVHIPKKMSSMAEMMYI